MMTGRVHVYFSAARIGPKCAIPVVSDPLYIGRLKVVKEEVRIG